MVAVSGRGSIRAAALALLLFALLVPAALASPGVDPLAPPSSGGVARLDALLARLTQHRRLLMIAAHPDDEDTRLLALVARGQGGEAAYLSLSRGEGGQNLIGSELGTGLGLIRSRELMAARRVDGARQYFGRAYDFGYTRSLEETFARWPPEALLADTVAVIRSFAPQAIVSVWAGDESAGHGQHQAAGVIAARAFAAAGDPRLFPEAGPPWTAEAFLRLAFFDPEAATVRVALGVLEPVAGRSILQLALASRSRHRSQDMGLLELLGDAESGLVRIAGPGTGDDGTGGAPALAGAERDLFAGIDTRLEALAAPLGDGALAADVTARLARVRALVTETRAALSPVRLEAATAPVAEAVTELRAAHDRLAAASSEGDGSSAVTRVRRLVAEKLTLAEEALAAAAGIAVDAWTERETVVAGATLEVHAQLWNAGRRTVGELVLTPIGGVGAGDNGAWTVAADRDAGEPRGFFTARPTRHRVLELTVPADAPATVPYFLRRPRDGDLYDWAGSDAAGAPFEPPPLRLRFAFPVAGVPIALEREVVRRHADQAIGEVRRPLRVVPAIEVEVAPSLLVWRLGARTSATVAATVRSRRETPAEVRVEIAAPDGWPAVAARPLRLEAAAAANGNAATAAVELELVAPETLSPGRYAFEIAARDESGARYTGAVALLDYPHIRPTPMPVPSRLEASVGEIALPPLERVGYLRGASDRVPEALAAIGVPIELLDAARLREIGDGELAAYDAIVIGSRAYESDPALARANGRLLDYARGGGLLIVQYQQYAFVRGGFAPFALDIARPHHRTTDEASAVRLLAPDHPLLHRPNEIVDADWQGWVQERGLYFAGSWDDAYRPLLALPDPEGVERMGALLVAPLGEGTYVYTGLAFFRQLPAGVIGAYRLFANLLALGDRT